MQRVFLRCPDSPSISSRGPCGLIWAVSGAQIARQFAAGAHVGYLGCIWANVRWTLYQTYCCKYVIIYLYQGSYSLQRLDAMDLHLSRSLARLPHSCIVIRVVSLMLPIQLFLGRPLPLLPSIFPSSISFCIESCLLI